MKLLKWIEFIKYIKLNDDCDDDDDDSNLGNKLSSRDITTKWTINGNNKKRNCLKNYSSENKKISKCIFHEESAWVIHAMRTFDKVYKLLYLITSFTVQVFCTVSLPGFVSLLIKHSPERHPLWMCINWKTADWKILFSFYFFCCFFVFCCPFWSCGLRSHDMNQFRFGLGSRAFRISIVIAFSPFDDW